MAIKDIKAKKTSVFVKFRHRFFLKLVSILLFPIKKFIYHIKIDKFKEKPKRSYLVLSNHQTPLDQFFVSSAIKGDLYFVASEDLLSNGAVSRFIDFAVGLIPIKKQTSDIHAVRECIRLAAEGATIVMFPEGNRTYSGETCYIKPTVASLAKKLGLPILLFNIRGGYGAQPRWSDVVRKGKMRCGITRVIEPHEYKDMSSEELYQIIKDWLYVDEYHDAQTFYHKKSAEYLERLFYVCPECGLTRIKSKNDTVACDKCGRKAVYTKYKTFEGDLPFKNVLEWYEFQERFVADADLSSYENTPAFTDEAEYSAVNLYKNKTRISKCAKIALFENKIVVNYGETENVFPFDGIGTVTVLGRNKLNIYFGEKLYQLKGSKSFNAVKYMHFYNIYRQKHKKAGENNDVFLGL